MPNEDFLSPMKILDFEKAGRKVVEWAKDPASRPLDGDMQAFRTALQGIVDVPARYTSFELVQGDSNHFIMRLPPKAQLEQSEALAHREKEDGNPASSYGIPDFYKETFLDEQNGGDFDNVKFFYCRIADYTIRGCR